MENPISNVKIRINDKIEEPPLFKVIYMNDEVTTMEFVVTSLVDYFNYSSETAMHITQEIHQVGSAIVAVLPYEIAEQKGIEVTVDARSQGYPLTVKIEAQS
jgi:ATP-dependent Clp protease adaptor protein ClpS